MKTTVIDVYGKDGNLLATVATVDAAAAFTVAHGHATNMKEREIAAMDTDAITWLPTTAEKYDEMMNILPPAAYLGAAFLVGEPMDSDATGRPRFEAYWQRGTEYVVSSRAITPRELRAELLARTAAYVASQAK